MTRSYLPLPRLAALSVAITLGVSPIASAQAVNVGAPVTAPAAPVFLSPAAFARLVQPAQIGEAPHKVAGDPRRSSLLRSVAVAIVRQAQTAPAAAPQRSWVARHKVAVVLIGVAAVAGITTFAVVSCCWGE